jgi:hypothetical protein
MEKIVEYVNEGKRQAENSQKIMAIQSNIDGGEVPHSIFSFTIFLCACACLCVHV